MKVRIQLLGPRCKFIRTILFFFLFFSTRLKWLTVIYSFLFFKPSSLDTKISRLISIYFFSPNSIKLGQKKAAVATLNSRRNLRGERKHGPVVQNVSPPKNKFTPPENKFIPLTPLGALRLEYGPRKSYCIIKIYFLSRNSFYYLTVHTGANVVKRVTNLKINGLCAANRTPYALDPIPHRECCLFSVPSTVPAETD
jgi:hypothetical protein